MDKNQFNKNMQMIRDQFQGKHRNIGQEIQDHIGQFAILIEKRGRHSLSFFIQITGKCTAKYRCYDYEGTFRCCLTKYLDIISIIIGEQELVYLDDM